MENTPYIHLFRTSEAFYLYDVNTDKILNVPEIVYFELNNDSTTEGSCNETYQFISMLKSNGFLKANRVRVSEHPDTDLHEYYLQNKVKQIILQVTQSCNLRCNYCAYSGSYKNRKHSQKQMSYETAVNAIDFLIRHSRDSGEVIIGFYGGEKLIA